MIRKLKTGQYRLYSRNKYAKTGKRKNLGTFTTRNAAEAHEKAVHLSYVDWEEKTMGGESHDGFHAPSSWLVYQECSHDRADACLKESLSERHRIGHAHADLLHQPGRTWPESRAASRAE